MGTWWLSIGFLGSLYLFCQTNPYGCMVFKLFSWIASRRNLQESFLWLMGRLSCWHLQRQICPCEAAKGKLEVEPLNPAGGMAALTKRCIRKDPGPADYHDIFLAHMILINYDWLITCLYHSQSETIPSDMVGILVFNFITPYLTDSPSPATQPCGARIRCLT